VQQGILAGDLKEIKMDWLTTTLFAIGFVLLIVGAELLVRGAVRFAELAGVSQLVIGLTVVAYGTSAPELAVTVQSVLADPPQPDLALGNVVGSNISNVLLVLGLSAAVAPLVVSRQLVRQGVPLMIAASAAVAAMGRDGRIDLAEGCLLVAAAVAYTLYAVHQSRLETARIKAANGSSPTAQGTWWEVIINLALVVIGLGLLLQGASWLVDGAVMLSHYLGVSELIIGLTVVAVGTSLPEIATSVVASVRGQRDIAVGNVIGSNIFNILLVLGLTAVVGPKGVIVSPAAMHFDIPVMIVVAVACLPIFFNGYRIARWEGILFLVYYAAYVMYLVLQATRHDALRPFSMVVLYFMAPLTIVTLLVLTWRMIQSERKK
jgi:cation:H+ antiporter